MRNIIVVLFMLLLFGCGKQNLWTKGKVKQKTFTQEIPIEIINGLVFLQIKINGKPYRFLLDTGAPMLVDAGLVEDLGLKTKTFGTVEDSYGRRNRIDYTNLQTVSIGEVDFIKQGTLVADMRSIPTFNCFDIDGLLGASLMRDVCWQIDYDKEVIRFRENCTSFTYNEDAIFMPFRTNGQGTPKLIVSLNESFVLRDLTLDFGSSSALSLDMESAGAKFIPEEAIVYTSGIAGVGLYGAQRDSIWFMPPEVLQTADGDTLLSRIPVRVRREGGGLFGTQILSRFRSTIDWERNRLVLEPRDIKESIAMNTFGCSLNINGVVLEIGQLVHPSPAVNAGLAVGDTVLTLNGQSVMAEDYCDMKALFRNERAIEITVLKQGIEHTTILNRFDAFAEW